MAQKTANLYARIEPEVKKEAESILAELGLSASSAINLFYRQIIRNQGLPFELSLPKELDMSKMTKEEFDQRLQEAIDEAKKGKVRPAEEVFEELYKELGWKNTK